MQQAACSKQWAVQGRWWVVVRMAIRLLDFPRAGCIEMVKPDEAEHKYLDQTWINTLMVQRWTAHGQSMHTGEQSMHTRTAAPHSLRIKRIWSTAPVSAPTSVLLEQSHIKAISKAPPCRTRPSPLPNPDFPGLTTGARGACKQVHAGRCMRAGRVHPDGVRPGVSFRSSPAAHHLSGELHPAYCIQVKALRPRP